MTLPDASPPPTVSAQASRGHRSTLLSQAVRLGCKAGSVIILARLLTPAEHGLYAMAASVFLFLFLFRDLGFGTAAVQAARLDEVQRASLFWAHVALGGVLTLAGLAVARPTAAFYATPAVGPMLAAMAPVFLLMGLGGLPRALLARELQFEKLNFVETTAAILGTVAMIAAALAGAGGWSFVGYLVVSEAAIAALAWRACPWRPRQRPQWRSVRGLARTGRQLTRYHALNYVLFQLDTFAIGHVLGARSVGLYSRASQLLGLTNLHVAGPLTSVALAALSRVQADTAEFRREARATTTMIAHLVLPVAAVCAALPQEIVRVVLGDQWPEAAPILRWLAIHTGISTATSLALSINIAAGQTRRLALGVAAALPFLALAVWLGLPHGAAGVAAAVTLVNLTLTVPRLWWTLRGSPLGAIDFLHALTGPVVTAAGLGAGLLAGHRFGGGPPGLALAGAIGGGVGALGLLAIAWPRLREEWRYTWSHLPLSRAITTRPSA
jgi:PST family polysaccharide transporter